MDVFHLLKHSAKFILSWFLHLAYSICMLIQKCTYNITFTFLFIFRMKDQIIIRANQVAQVIQHHRLFQFLFPQEFLFKSTLKELAKMIEATESEEKTQRLDHNH